MQLGEGSHELVGQEQPQLNEDIFRCAGGKRKTARGMSRLEDELTGTYLKHVDQRFGKRIQCKFHLGEDYQIILARTHWSSGIMRLASDLQQGRHGLMYKYRGRENGRK
jgi:hypothetical protein